MTVEAETTSKSRTVATSTDQVLEARGVTVRFEGVAALDGVDCLLHCGEILGLIGPNGAGKTTLVNALTGFQALDHGSIWVSGQDVTQLRAHERARLGISRTFQSTRLFRSLSVFENVELGGLGQGLGRKQAKQRAKELLAGYGMDAIASTRANDLPHGEQRRVGILRALASRPTFLLLDEPAAGLDESETDALMAFVLTMMKRFGCGVLVIEHDMRLIMGMCERIQVLDFGKTIAVGSPEEIRTDPGVAAAYLGDEEVD
jgi:branched-chain amino acid transport system ATP-binding protein